MSRMWRRTRAARAGTRHSGLSTLDPGDERWSSPHSTRVRPRHRRPRPGRVPVIGHLSACDRSPGSLGPVPGVAVVDAPPPPQHQIGQSVRDEGSVAIGLLELAWRTGPGRPIADSGAVPRGGGQARIAGSGRSRTLVGFARTPRQRAEAPFGRSPRPGSATREAYDEAPDRTLNSRGVGVRHARERSVTLALWLRAIVGPSGRRRSLPGLGVVAAEPPRSSCGRPDGRTPVRRSDRTRHLG